jgi:hypothetical protein
MSEGRTDQVAQWLDEELEVCPQCHAPKLVPASAVAGEIRVCLDCGVVPNPERT